MKNILFLFLLCSIFAQAQTTTKSYALAADGITYIESVTVTLEDGSFVTTGSPVGPASALAADQADKIEAVTKEVTQQAFAALKTGTRIAEFNKVDTTITDLTTLSPLTVILNRYKSELTKSGWTIDEGTGFVPLVFTVNAQNKLRFSINGAATKSATIYGDFIKFSAYPSTGKSEIFYLHPKSDRYFSLSSGTIIKTPQ